MAWRGVLLRLAAVTEQAQVEEVGGGGFGGLGTVVGQGAAKHAGGQRDGREPEIDTVSSLREPGVDGVPERWFTRSRG